MNITFKDGWDMPENNRDVYANGRPCSAREIYVMLGKLATGAIWCDSDQMYGVREFVRDDLLGGANIRVNKGIHGDRLERRFGKHITVAVNSGCRTGNTFHIYGEVKSNGAWEPDIIIKDYDPRKSYHINHKLYHAMPPREVIQLVGSIPPAAPGSRADLAHW